jgi:hypothetical protein
VTVRKDKRLGESRQHARHLQEQAAVRKLVGAKPAELLEMSAQALDAYEAKIAKARAALGLIPQSKDEREPQVNRPLPFRYHFLIG